MCPPFHWDSISSKNLPKRITPLFPYLHTTLYLSFTFSINLGYNEVVAIGRKKKALVHIAKEDLHLDEESYRQIKKGVAGVESSTQLSTEGFEKVMKRFQEMGFKGLLPYPYHPAPKGRLIPSDSPQGLETITQSQNDFISYLLGELKWEEGHYHAFCKRIIKSTEPRTKRDGQKIIIGLMAILRKRSLAQKRHPIKDEK
ncbi:MAG: DUF1018 domain-containing protein [Deltaproteobacteria bacterium]|nr:DUF1018 domain-containing protein [Deltaproteobacteria bacterium]